MQQLMQKAERTSARLHPAPSQGTSLSSAILYLAIVVIWACILVPRWVRRPQHVVQQSPVPATVEDDLAAGTADADAVAAAGSAAAVPAAAMSAAATGSAATGSAETWSVRVTSEQTVAARAVATQATSGMPPVSRSAILQARRRMMTTLVTLAIAAFTCTAVSLTPWWICVPPAGMLGMYLFLLREAARADAEMYRQRLEASRIRAARQRAREAWAARVPVPQPTAQIIDISGRVGDQLYDQYADATMRAVGD